jgi:hypothetical protein
MATLDIRVDEKLVFSQRIDSHQIEVAEDGGSVNVSILLSEKLPSAEDVGETMDIDAIHARLQAENQASPTADVEPSGEKSLGPVPGSAVDGRRPSSDDEPSADKVEPAPGNESGTSDGGAYAQEPSQSGARKGS